MRPADGYPLRELALSASILRAVLESEALRRWLLPLILEKKQVRSAQWLGLAQSTVNRIVNQDAYDFRLTTVSRIATTFGFARLSDFILHVESDLQENRSSLSLHLTSPDQSVRDKRPAPHPGDKGAEGRPHATTGVSQLDLSRVVADLHTIGHTLADMGTKFLTVGAPKESPIARDTTRKSVKPQGRRRAGNR